MAFTVQSGTSPVAGANAYVTTTEFRDYHRDRGNTVTGGSSAMQQAIVKATDYLDYRFYFVGERQLIGQTTEWPRTSARDIDGENVSGIPTEVKEACYEYALLELNGTPLMPTPTRDATGRAIQESLKKVGPLTTAFKYANGAAFQMPKIPVSDQRLRVRGLIRSGGRMLRA